MTDPRSPVSAGRSRFCTTHWSVIRQAGADDADHARQALGQLFETYWYPLYAFARRRGHPDHDAMDLTQGFFAQLLDCGVLESLSPEKGRFRSFLLASFTNFIANQRRAATAIRRGGLVATFSIHADEFRTRYEREQADHETPELLFQRSWVEALLAKVRGRLEENYRTAGKAELFTLLEPYLTQRSDAVPRAEISRQLKLSSAAVAMSLHRMRRRYGELLREEVALTVDDPAEVEDELRGLMEAIGRPS